MIVRLPFFLVALFFTGWLASQAAAEEKPALPSDLPPDLFDSSSLPGIFQPAMPDLNSATSTGRVHRNSFRDRRPSAADPFRRTVSGRIIADSTETLFENGVDEVKESSRRGSLYTPPTGAGKPLPSRREQATRDAMTGLSPIAPSGFDPLGWNSLSPVVPTQSLVTPLRIRPKGAEKQALSALDPNALLLPSEDIRESQLLPTQPERLFAPERNTKSGRSGLASLKQSSQLRDRTKKKGDSTPAGNVLNTTAEQKKVLSKAEKYNKTMGVLGGKDKDSTPIARLRSTTLSSQGGMLHQQGSLGKSSLSTSPGARTKASQPLPARFHANTPGDATQRDYSYQYQGPRHYSTGDLEYGHQSSYQGLPYYRRGGRSY